MTQRRLTRGFTTSINKFIKASPWIGPTDAPAVASLKAMAKELDTAEFLSPAMLSQFGLSFRALQKRAPAEDAAEDEFEAALRQELA